MQTTSTDATPVCVVLNRRRFNELLGGSQSQVQIARRLGVDPSTLWRITTGKTTPSNQVIAQIVRAFPEVPFNDLFDIEEVA